MGPEMDVSRMEDDIVVGVAYALGEQLLRAIACVTWGSFGTNSPVGSPISESHHRISRRWRPFY